VVLGQTQAEGQVLDLGQESVADVLPARHPTGQWIAQESAAQGHVRLPGLDRRDELRDARGVVLIVGVQHDDDVGAHLEGTVVAGLLVSAVSAILLVNRDVESEVVRDVDRLILRHVVDQNDVVNDVVRNVVVGPFERECRVVGRHHDHDAWLSGRLHAHGLRAVAVGLQGWLH